MRGNYDDYEEIEHKCTCRYCHEEECTKECVALRETLGWLRSKPEYIYIAEIATWNLGNNVSKITKLLIKDNGGDVCCKCDEKGLDKVHKVYYWVGSAECNKRVYCAEHRKDATKRCRGYCSGTFCSAHCDPDDHNCRGSGGW